MGINKKEIEKSVEMVKLSDFIIGITRNMNPLIRRVKIKKISNMWFLEEIQNKVYEMYLNGTSLRVISMRMDLSDMEVDEIIDYMNEVYNA